jgi:O-glycosyl hydrolase
VSEAEQYYDSDLAEVLKAVPTAYSLESGSYKSNDSDYVWWWLRSKGDRNEAATNITNRGTINAAGPAVTNEAGSVRPIIVIGIE